MTAISNHNESEFGMSQPEIGSRVRDAQQLARSGKRSEAECAFREILAAVPSAFSAAVGLTKLLDSDSKLGEAKAVLIEGVKNSASHANVLTAARFLSQWEERPEQGARVLRTAFTGVGTLEPVTAHYRVGCSIAGLHSLQYLGEFGQWGQDLLNPSSALYSFRPDLIIIDIDSASLFPKNSSRDTWSEAELDRDRAAGISQLKELLESAERNAPMATVVLNSWPLPDYAPLGILDMKLESGQRRRFMNIWRDVSELISTDFPKVVLLDKERLEARHGKSGVRDDRLWYMASSPYSESFLPVLASEYLRVVRALTGLTRKCIVLDLDNTLWGGVIGEDGINQIKLGGSAAPGNAFYDFQLSLLALNKRGILLAVCSKNNPEEALDAIENHPSMVLRKSNFAAIRTNWQDKATNIAAIAKELNIGLDSLVFMDDNPAERGLVRQQLPDVLTIELPKDPSGYVRALEQLDVFETLAVTDEDRRRAEQYQEQHARKEFETEASGDVHSYLRGLNIAARFEQANPFTLPRIAQLTNKTNQFNVTTRRYTEAEIQAKVDDLDRWLVYSVNVSDRFGDSGLTGVAIVEKSDHVWNIDSFLLSCRVLGRGIETAFVKTICDRAWSSGVQTLRGEFIPTQKNAPAAQFFTDHGFQLVAQNGEIQTYELKIAENNLESPDWLRIDE